MLNNILDLDSFVEKTLCSISEPALIFDENMKVIWTNPSAEMFFGHSTEYMNGESCYSLFSRYTECINDCPVSKSLHSGKQEALVVEDIDCPYKMIDAIPFKNGEKNVVLSIIHSVPEINRDNALERDFAARLNLSGTLASAAPEIIKVVRNLTTVSVCALYAKKHDQFDLFYGTNAPLSIYDLSSEINFASPLYLPTEKLPFAEKNDFPDGAAIIPITSPGKEINYLLFAGSGNMDTKSRSRLEMIASVLESCIGRLTASL